MSDVEYTRDEWLAAVEAAEDADWREVDAGVGGPLAVWLCEQVYRHDMVEQDVYRITAALNALRDQGVEDFSPERLMDVILSCKGEVWGDPDGKVELNEGEILAEPEGSASQVAYRFDTGKW